MSDEISEEMSQHEPDAHEEKAQRDVAEETPAPNVVKVPDIPLPETAAEKEVPQDTFESACRFAIVGAGQGGSRIAETFWKLGYRRVCIVNTAKQDMAMIAIPEHRKLLIGDTGAGKDINVAMKLADQRYEDILDFMRRSFEGGYDRILICIGAGGGTGAGTVFALIRASQDLNESLGVGRAGGSKVGVLVALPTRAEGKRVNRNTYLTVYGLLGNILRQDSPTVTPLVILDNERIKDIYPGLPVQRFWDTANRSVCMLLHLFNTIACQDSQYTSFDAADFETILSSGVITFGATPLQKWQDPTDVSYAIRDNLRKNILAGGMDLSQGNVAGCVVIGSPSVLNEIPQENLEHGFEQLSRVLGEGSTVHRGIYPGDKEGLVVYTMIGGLGEPEERLQEIGRIGGVADDEVHE